MARQFLRDTPSQIKLIMRCFVFQFEKETVCSILNSSNLLQKKNLHKKYLYSFRIIRFFRVNGATQAIFGASGKIPAAKDLLNENLSVSFDRLIFYVWVYVTRELSKYSMTKFPRYTSLMESLFSKLQTYSRQRNSKKTLSHIFPCKLQQIFQK